MFLFLVAEGFCGFAVFAELLPNNPKSTKIVNRSSGEITKGRVPPYSVVVPGAHKDLYAVHIIKTVDAKTRSKTSINDLLRD